MRVVYVANFAAGCAEDEHAVAHAFEELGHTVYAIRQDFMNDLLKVDGVKSREDARRTLAEFAYKQADAMMKEREK